ncbi:hypothetical protein HK096_001969 [Nowakowskiella sp. JEL0078]|nr:hypothetical protein HK096_001969 [Nowakowskiella sp. JEL0078]
MDHEDDIMEMEDRLQEIMDDDFRIIKYLNLKEQEYLEAMEAFQNLLTKSSESAMEKLFVERALQCLQRSYTGTSKPEVNNWTITSWEVEIGEPIARGGFAEVSKGIWLGHTSVAVKRLHMKLDTRRLREDFFREVTAWYPLRHPHVLELLGACSSAACPFMISPLMVGGHALQYLEKHPPSIWRNMKLLYEVSQGIAYLHNRRVVHGDLKAINILVDGYGKAVVSDFGFAILKRVTSTRTTNETTVKTVSGTLRWMSPERLQGGKAVNAVDVYAFSMTAYEVLSGGDVPLSDIPDSLVYQSIVINDLRPDYPLPKEEENACNYALWGLMKLCWQRAPERRPGFDYITNALQNMVQTAEILERHEISSNSEKSQSLAYRFSNESIKKLSIASKVVNDDQEPSTSENRQQELLKVVKELLAEAVAAREVSHNISAKIEDSNEISSKPLPDIPPVINVVLPSVAPSLNFPLSQNPIDSNSFLNAERKHLNHSESSIISKSIGPSTSDISKRNEHSSNPNRHPFTTKINLEPGTISDESWEVLDVGIPSESTSFDWLQNLLITCISNVNELQNQWSTFNRIIYSNSDLGDQDWPTARSLLRTWASYVKNSDPATASWMESFAQTLGHIQLLNSRSSLSTLPENIRTQRVRMRHLWNHLRLIQNNNVEPNASDQIVSASQIKPGLAQYPEAHAFWTIFWGEEVNSVEIMEFLSKIEIWIQQSINKNIIRFNLDPKGTGNVTVLNFMRFFAGCNSLLEACTPERQESIPSTSSQSTMLPAYSSFLTTRIDIARTNSERLIVPRRSFSNLDSDNRPRMRQRSQPSVNVVANSVEEKYFMSRKIIATIAGDGFWDRYFKRNSNVSFAKVFRKLHDEHPRIYFEDKLYWGQRLLGLTITDRSINTCIIDFNAFVARLPEPRREGQYLWADIVEELLIEKSWFIDPKLDSSVLNTRIADGGWFLDRISFNGLSNTDKKIPMIANELKRNTNVRFLDLSSSSLRTGVTSLVEGLRVNNTLFEINLCDNHIDDLGLRMLDHVLVNFNFTIREIRLDRNDIKMSSDDVDSFERLKWKKKHYDGHWIMEERTRRFKLKLPKLSIQTSETSNSGWISSISHSVMIMLEDPQLARQLNEAKIEIDAAFQHHQNIMGQLESTRRFQRGIQKHILHLYAQLGILDRQAALMMLPEYWAYQDQAQELQITLQKEMISKKLQEIVRQQHELDATETKKKLECEQSLARLNALEEKEIALKKKRTHSSD